MAVAVLKGDFGAAAGLADLLLETVNERPAAVDQLRPIKYLPADRSKLRIVFFVDPGLGPDVTVDRERMFEAVRNWLNGGDPPVLTLFGMQRMEVYEVR